MQINGQEFQFNSLLPRDVERYENAISLFQEKSSGLSSSASGLKVSKVISQGTNNAIEFIDNVLGIGSCEKIFGDIESISMLDCLGVMEQINNDFINNTKLLNERLKGYSRARVD